MLKKGSRALFLLILVVGTVVALINPRFISPVNLANTANLIGLFGLFSLGEGFVIITGGIDLSIGSMFALLGVIFVDLLVTYEVPWPLAVLIIVARRLVLGSIHGFLITRMRLQPFVVTLCGLLIYRGIARWYTDDGTAGFAFGQSFPTLEWLTTGRTFGVPHTLHRLRSRRASSMGVLLHRSVFGRYLFAVGTQRGGGALFRHPHRRDRRLRLHHLRRAGRPLGGLPRDVHALDLAGLARQFLRALRHRRRGARRLLAARRRRLGPRHRPRRDPAPGPAEPRQPARHSELAQLRRDGRR